MLKISAKSKLAPGEVMNKAFAFFGPSGYGLRVKEQNEGCITFEGGGGGVQISACVEGKGATVDVEAREWENQAREFLTKIK
ncbi:MAG: hypothetical protein HYX85_00135 [Chloroflexi bacterium]|nr:hypothetical protein [Chloroflexota bacterium]